MVEATMMEAVTVAVEVTMIAVAMEAAVVVAMEAVVVAMEESVEGTMVYVVEMSPSYKCTLPIGLTLSSMLCNSFSRT